MQQRDSQPPKEGPSDRVGRGSGLDQGRVSVGGAPNLSKRPSFRQGSVSATDLTAMVPGLVGRGSNSRQGSTSAEGTEARDTTEQGITPNVEMATGSGSISSPPLNRLSRAASVNTQMYINATTQLAAKVNAQAHLPVKAFEVFSAWHKAISGDTHLDKETGEIVYNKNVIKSTEEYNKSIEECKKLKEKGIASAPLILCKSPYHFNGTAQGKRVTYEPTKERFGEFAQKFEKNGCNFHRMKANYQDPSIPLTILDKEGKTIPNPEKVTKQDMQILCDLRAAYFETKLFPGVMAKFPNMLDPSRNSTGSVEVTSDWDPPFIIGENFQTKETKAVQEFNKLFQAEFGGVAGLVFDTNAYSNQYRREATTERFQHEYSELQEKSSMVMARMNMPEKIFNKLIEGIQKKLKGAELDAFNKQLGEAIEDANELKAQLRNKMIEVAERVNVKVPQGVDPEAFLERIKQKGGDLFEQIERAAKNELHETIKISYEDLEVQRAELMDAVNVLKEMKAATDPMRSDATEKEKMEALTKFAETFKQTHATNIKNYETEMEKEIAKLKKEGKDPREIEKKMQPMFAHMATLNACSITIDNALEDPKALREMRDAFFRQQENNGKIKELEKNRAGFEADPAATYAQIYEQLKSKIETLTKKDSKADITVLKKELDELAKFGSDKDPTKLDPAKLDKLKKKISADIKELKDARTEEEDAGNQLFDVATIFNVEADRLMVAMDRFQTMGMNFADEAHVSADAFDRVVLGIQVGKKDVHSIRAEANALREINAFGFAHMEHAHGKGGVSMLSNGVKYMHRMFIVLDVLKERALSLGIIEDIKDKDEGKDKDKGRPEFFDDKKVGYLKDFITGLVKKRSDPDEAQKFCDGWAATHDFQTLAELPDKDKKTRTIDHKEASGKTGAERIVEELENLHVEILAWSHGLKKAERNAIYKEQISG